MTGDSGWSRSDLEKSSLRELMIVSEVRKIAAWDSTSIQASLIHNLLNTVGAMFSRSKPQVVSMYDYHPYRQAPSPQCLSPEMLRAMGDAHKAAGGKVIKRRKRETDDRRENTNANHV